MAQKKAKRNVKEKTKAKLHPRNKHIGRYDLDALTLSFPELGDFVKENQYGDNSIDFANPDAVKALNKALLLHYYGVKGWDIPDNYLVPPIPGRADYIHNVADLLATSNGGEIPTGKKIKCLDIGVGANCVYPLIGNHEYGWSFIGADIDPVSIASATAIVDANPDLKTRIKFRHQPNHKNIFPGVLEKTERIHLSICNPPFHATFGEAQAAALKKLNNLNKEKVTEVTLNFGGQSKELWCHGGEGKFVKDMIAQSVEFSNSCLWFTTLISNQANLQAAYAQLKQVEAVDVKTLAMGQGNKISRVLAWTFQTPERQQLWFPKTESVIEQP
ncbi:23S rRNA (adenine(1618)-N(6))-methyltransferase RlmF [Pedobacter alpinus]|uniref:Ribosomal RNA large subunit methyltransferase F n=1 Tax=Pedobacter alpinus TaxID=1590643 RepID=A0ABW5TSB7_9SPHI